ncbi:ATP-dependent DNA helicase [Trichonephila clavipes]|nr:ATP-dependent DNA helicase [Trichonephila clavipes]
MAHKKSLEAFYRTLQDLRGNEQLFGGALTLLAGDFRQTLPVIPRSTPADGLNACLKSSVLWRWLPQRSSLPCNQPAYRWKEEEDFRACQVRSRADMLRKLQPVLPVDETKIWRKRRMLT